MHQSQDEYDLLKSKVNLFAKNMDGLMLCI